MQNRNLWRVGIIVSVLLMFSIVVGIGQAQSLNQNLITYRLGDLWEFNIQGNTATQLTEWGYNGGPILSPDGTKIAYLSTASEVVDRFDSGQPSQFAGSPPTNIWVMDIATKTFTRIADQSGSGEVGYLRSVPSWSPDSSRLVWSQLDPNYQALDQATLQVYDLNTGLQATLSSNFSMGFQDGGIWMPDVFWGEGGIARILFTYTETSRNPFLYMEIYNPANGNLTRYDLGYQQSQGNYVQDYVWVNHQGRSMIAMRIQDRWELFDPTNGVRSALSAPPRLKAKFVSGGLELIPVSIPSTSGSSEIQWQAVLGQQQYNTGLTTYGVDTQSTPAISPDGSQIAWHNGDGVSTWSPSFGQTGRIADERQSFEVSYLIPAYQNVAWAPTEWITSTTTVIVQPTVTPVVTNNTCELLPPRLTVGQTAVVNPGPSNRLRTAPTVNSTIIDALPPGDPFLIENGPICADGYNWYYIRNNQLAGWTAEGGDGQYWLTVDTSNTFCYNSPPTRLTSNSTAIVLPGEPNNVRNNPTTVNSQVLDVIPAGASFVTTGGYVCDGQGRRWYPVQYNGTLGWTVEGVGNEYWIAPAPGSEG